MRRPLSLIVCFLIPGIVLLLGFVFAGIYGFREIPKLVEESGRGQVPEGFEIELRDPGKYTLWYHVREKEPVSDLGESLEGLPPGARVLVYDAETKNEIEMVKWLSATKNIGGEASVSLGTFDVLAPGKKVFVKGTGFQKSAVVSISPANMTSSIRVVLVLLAIVVGTLALAILLFLLLLHRRRKTLEKSDFL